MRRLAGLIALLLAGCAVGPKYQRPADPVAPGASAFVDPGMSKVSTGPAEGQWWRLFADPALDRLVTEALAHNTDLRQAAANLRRARAVLSEARAGRFPTADLSASYARQHIGLDQPQAALSGAGERGDGPSGFEFDFFQAGFDVSYEVDLFGRVSRRSRRRAAMRRRRRRRSMPLGSRSRRRRRAPMRRLAAMQPKPMSCARRRGCRTRRWS